MANDGQLSNDLLQQEGIDRATILKRLPYARYTHIEEAAQLVLNTSNTYQRYAFKTKEQNTPAVRRSANQREAFFIESMWRVISENQYVTSIDVLKFSHRSWVM
jgi:hypothetical protein